MKIREVSPCQMCKWEPVEEEDKSEMSMTGTKEYFFSLSDECPMSMDINCDIPVETWYDITRLTGCTCFRQKGDKNV